MVLTKEELISAIKDEVRLLQHLVSKVEPGMLEYRPVPQTRSLMEVLRYLTLFPGLHLRGTLVPVFDMQGWVNDFNAAAAAANARDLDQIKEAIGEQAAMAEGLLANYPESEFRSDLEMFGAKATRGVWVVRMVLNHYAAYRMQLFVYLKAAGRTELNTMNLWVGVDGPMQPPPV
jgi:hypothetical protein